MGKKSRTGRPQIATTRGPGEQAGVIALIEQLMRDRQFTEALRAGQTLVEKFPLDPQAHAVLGAVLADLGNPLEGLRQLEMAQRLGRMDDAVVLRNMVLVTSMLRYPIHSLRTARRGLRVQSELPQQQAESHALFVQVVSSGDDYVAGLLNEGTLAHDVGEETLYLMEQSSRALSQGELDRAVKVAEDAVDLAQYWSLAVNHLAAVLFTTNEPDRALAVAFRAMEQEPDSPVLRATIVRLLTMIGREEQAGTLLEELLAIPATTVTVAQEQAKALASLDRDGQIYEILAPLAGDDQGALHPAGRFLLGVAAANLGKRDEARAAWRSLHQQGLPQARTYTDMLLRKDEPPTPSGRFLYFAAAEMVPSSVLDELSTKVHPVQDSARLLEIAQAFPRLPEALCETFFTRGVDPRLAVDLLLPLRERRPEVIHAVQVFAGGRLGEEHQRVYAHIALRAAGVESAEDPASIWTGGARRTFILPAIELAATASPAYQDSVRDLFVRAVEAQEQNDAAGAADLYRQVLEIDPTIAEAEHNLGTALLLSNQFDEGRHHVERAHELDPEHVLARCNLATIALITGDLPAAQALLEPLTARRSFSLEEVIAYLRTRADVARAGGDPVLAETMLRALLAYDPENAQARERLASLVPAAAGAGQ